MDEAEKRRLKKLGKARVEQQSQDRERRLREANPAALGSDAWVANYKSGIDAERKLREAPPDRMAESVALEHFVLLPVEPPGDLIPVSTWYVQCAHCRDLLHTDPSAPVTCQCGAVTLWIDGYPPLLQGRYAEGALLGKVRLIGRGTVTKRRNVRIGSAFRLIGFAAVLAAFAPEFRVESVNMFYLVSGLAFFMVGFLVDLRK